MTRRSGISLVTVNAMARNRTVRVDLSTIDAICEALGCDPSELFEHEYRRKRGR
jgi:DNA-binding Xre family transcriptional regulator